MASTNVSSCRFSGNASRDLSAKRSTRSNKTNGLLLTGPSTRGVQVVARAGPANLTPKLYNFGRAAKNLYGENGSKITEHTKPFSDVEASLDLISEATVDLQALQMANQPLTALKLVRLAEFVSPDEWIRPLNEWSPPPMPEPKLDGDGKGKAWLMAEQEREHAEIQFESLVRHLLLQYDDAPHALINSFAPFHGAQPAQHWARAESPFLSEDNWLLSFRFARVLVDVGAGQSALKALKANISPQITKPMGHEFMQTPEDVESPVHALRTAQVKGLGGSDSLSFQACRSVMGAMVGDLDQEEFAQSILLWMADREEELSQVGKASLIDHLVASYENSKREGKPFSMKGKTVNSVLKSAQGVYELFFPSGLGNMTFDGSDDYGNPCKVTVQEVLSADSLVKAGMAMQNCLQTQRGVLKYTARARSRSSSFWTVTYSYRPTASSKDDDNQVYALIFEVWNQSRIIHQAEGAGSSLPRQVALGHMETWARAQGVDWTTWEVW